MRRWAIAALFAVAGTLHFVIPAVYVKIMPPYLPAPLALVYISGAFEVLGGVGMLTRYRRAAVWGLIALLVAVFPANVYMATAHLFKPAWAAWARLPLQGVLIWWVWSARRSS